MSVRKRDEEPLGAIRAFLASGGPSSGPTTQGRGLKAALIALAGLAGVTAASAGISALRRRKGDAKNSTR